MPRNRTAIYDAIIVGGGIAGNALAAVLSRAGRSVLVLERTAAYTDRVRGEYLQPWGVAEAQRLGLHEALLHAGGSHHGPLRSLRRDRAAGGSRGCGRGPE